MPALISYGFSEEVADADVERPRIFYIAACRAFDFAVGDSVLAETELAADAVGYPAAAEIFVKASAGDII